MKRNIFTLLCAGTLLVTTGCSSFLEETPKSSITSAAYILTADQAASNTETLYETGAPNIYSTSTTIWAGTTSMLGGFVSGYFDNEYAGLELAISNSKTLTRNSVNVSDEMDRIWDACYSAISIANQGLADIPNLTDISSDLADQYVAESKFFRAFSYFMLVKTFGDVPLLTSAVDSPNGLEGERNASSEVYDLIVSDLTDAVAVLPNAAYADNSVRITSNVVNTLLAQVYLQMSGYPMLDDHYAEAAAAAKAVISSGKHSLTQSDNDTDQSAFNKLRTTDKLPESIYYYEFNATIRTSGYWPNYSLPNVTNGYGILKCGNMNISYIPTNGILNMYDSSEDIRIQNKQFFVDEYDYIDASGNPQVANFTENNHPMGNYYYYDEEALLNTGLGTKDVNIFRYSDVLLMAAEAVAKSGGSISEAAGYLAEVKARALLSTSSQTEASIKSELSALGADAFVEEVWAERLRELVLEFRIWDDICRTRKYPQFDENNPGTVTFIDVVGASNNWGKTFAETDLLWPISANELQRCPLMEQNPGY